MTALIPGLAGSLDSRKFFFFRCCWSWPRSWFSLRFFQEKKIVAADGVATFYLGSSLVDTNKLARSFGTEHVVSASTTGRLSCKGDSDVTVKTWSPSRSETENVSVDGTTCQRNIPGPNNIRWCMDLPEMGPIGHAYEANDVPSS